MITFKRLSLLLLALAIVGTGSVFANTIYDRYLAKKITVKINSVKLDLNGMAIDLDKNNRDVPMMRLDDPLTKVQVNQKDDSIFDFSRPNVNLTVYKADDKTKEQFGIVKKSEKFTVEIFATIDSLPVDVDAIKFVVNDPFGTEVGAAEAKLVDAMESFNSFADINVSFKYSGKYTINVYMKAASSDSYTFVAQRAIYSQL